MNSNNATGTLLPNTLSMARGASSPPLTFFPYIQHQGQLIWNGWLFFFILTTYRFDLELHMLHETPSGKTAVVGIMYKIGRADSFLSTVINYRNIILSHLSL